MIPWIREKLAERRAKWLLNRKSNRLSPSHADSEITTSSPLVISSSTSSPSSTIANNTSSSRAINNNINLNTSFRDDDDSQITVVARCLPTTTITAGSTTTCTSSSSSLYNSLSARSNLSNNHHTHHLGNNTPITTTTTIATTTGTGTGTVTAAKPIIKYQSKIKSARRSLEYSVAKYEEAEKNKEAGKESIKVRIICPSARVLNFQTDTHKRLADLKTDVIVELSDDLASMPLFASDIRSLGPRFRLVKADYEGIELSEQQTLAQLNIQDNELLVLVMKRNILQQMSNRTRETQSSLDTEIEQVTYGDPPTDNGVPLVDLNEIFQQTNLQFDVRKVLISLAQTSAMIIGVGPYADRLITMLKQKLINKRNYQNDTLKCLIDMGFKQEKAEYALKIHNDVYSTALEWLIQKQNEDMSVEEAVMSLPKSTSLCSPSDIMSNNGPKENVTALMEIVRIYSHREIPPTPDSVQTLTAMGFKETEVIEALKKTCNNRAAAVEWLCGIRTGSLVELREGLAQDSPVLKSILELPHVQLSLGNPKVLLAFLSILENENSLRIWSGSDTSSVITEILQKYHEEKHVMGINQFYNDRE